MKNNEEILEELREIAPKLSKLEKKVLDEVPVNYFSSFSNDVMKKIREEELGAIAPTLSQQEKPTNLRVPANYFNAFPEQMLKKVVSEQKQQTTSSLKWIQSLNNIADSIAGIVFKPRYAFALAGTFSIVIVGVMMFTKVEQCTDLDCKMASLTDAEINTYLDNNSDAYSDEIFETSSEESITGNEVYKEALQGISDTELDNAILD